MLSIKIKENAKSAKIIMILAGCLVGGVNCVTLVVKNGINSYSMGIGISTGGLKTKQFLKIGAKMSKLDTFNKDKFKCKKCKDYFDYPPRLSIDGKLLCDVCYKKWVTYDDMELPTTPLSNYFDDWCNNEQT
jgi:hypothetical protein